MQYTLIHSFEKCQIQYTNLQYTLINTTHNNFEIIHTFKVDLKFKVQYGSAMLTAVPIEAFRKMLISSFPRLKELLEGVPQYFKQVP